MIRNDLKKDDFWKIIPNREGIDPENYCVGILNEQDERDLKGYAINFISGEVMDYFYDDCPEDILIDASLAYPDRITKGRYSIQKTNMIGSGYIVKRGDRVLKGYIGANSSMYLEHFLDNKHYPIHRLIARLFIPRLNLDKSITVDHINRNRVDNSLVNLRWATKSMQAKNQSSSPTRQIFVKINKDGSHTIYQTKELTRFQKAKITQSLVHDGLYRGCKWIVCDPLVYDEVSGDFSKIDDSLWKLYTKGVECHPLGYIRKRGYFITKGTYTMSKRHFTVSKFTRRGEKKDHLEVSRCIYETFIGPIGEGLDIDHIDGNPQNNNVNNLRAVTRKENMNNLYTRIKLSKIVLIISNLGEEIISMDHSILVSRAFGLKQSTIYRMVKKFSCVNNLYVIYEKDLDIFCDKLRSEGRSDFADKIEKQYKDKMG